MARKKIERGNSVVQVYRPVVMLWAFHEIPFPRLIDIMETTGILERTLMEHIQTFKRDKVSIVRIGGQRFGYYELLDTGIYNAERVGIVVRKKYPKIHSKISQVAKNRYKDTIRDHKAKMTLLKRELNDSKNGLSKAEKSLKEARSEQVKLKAIKTDIKSVKEKAGGLGITDHKIKTALRRLEMAKNTLEKACYKTVNKEAVVDLIRKVSRAKERLADAEQRMLVLEAIGKKLTELKPKYSEKGEPVVTRNRVTKKSMATKKVINKSMREKN